MAVSPGGGTVFVTGSTTRGTGHFTRDAFATLAYNASTGAQLWAKIYKGPAGTDSGSDSVAVSPMGKTVFVTGTTSGTGHVPVDDYATVAYNATTGAQLWVKGYNGPANGFDAASSVAASPGGKTVFVTGYSPGAGLDRDYATIAYNATTGAQLWLKRYNGPANGFDAATSTAVGPNGNVYVTGTSDGTTSQSDFATIAYRG